MRFDSRTGKTAQLLTQGKLSEETERLGETWGSYSQKVDWKSWNYADTETVYYHENRLYIAVRVTCEYSWEAWIMFSCQASDGSDFRFEKEVTEYLWKNAIPYKTCYEGDEEESVYDLESVTGEFLYYLDGCIVMHFYDKKAKGDEDAHHRFVVYDISTGTFKKIEKYSEEYGYFKALGFSETSELVR